MIKQHSTSSWQVTTTNTIDLEKAANQLLAKHGIDKTGRRKQAKEDRRQRFFERRFILTPTGSKR